MKTVKAVYSIGFLACLAVCSPALSQTDSLRSRIEISSFVEATKVALNRSVKLTVTLSWIGEPDRYAIDNFDNPALSNLDIIGTSTVNRSEVSGGQTHVYKDFVYTLQPRELGMAYIEGVVVNCRDTMLDIEESLVTQRIPVEVLDPVPEPTDFGAGWLYITIAVVIIAAAGGLFVMQKRKKRAEDLETVEEIPISRVYLQRLKDEIDLETPDLSDDFSNISRLLRKFLGEQFSDRRLEGTTDELVQSLRGSEMEENHIANIHEILTRCDEIRFSGVAGNPDELHRFYTLFEAILHSFDRRSEQLDSQDETEKSN